MRQSDALHSAAARSTRHRSAEHPPREADRWHGRRMSLRAALPAPRSGARALRRSGPVSPLPAARRRRRRSGFCAVGLAAAFVLLPGSATAAHRPAVEREPLAIPEDGALWAPEARWAWPIAAPHPTIRPFEAPPTRYSAGHRGIDVAVGGGRTVLAPVAGTVHFAGTVVDRPVVSIRHDDGLMSSYEPVTTNLHEGDAVRRGDTIGEVVAGHCARVCLHFGVRRYGEYLSPLLYLGGVRIPVLLPTRRLP